jgi:hypothetical protein
VLFVVILLPVLCSIVSFIVFICSEYVTYRPNFKMFFTVMVPVLSSLSQHFICEVQICFSHVIHDDLLVLVLSAGLVFSPEEKSRMLSKHSVCDY